LGTLNLAFKRNMAIFFQVFFAYFKDLKRNRRLRMIEDYVRHGEKGGQAEIYI
jgi:hypothetical protein